jgi:hypothetical protein
MLLTLATLTSVAASVTTVGNTLCTAKLNNGSTLFRPLTAPVILPGTLVTDSEPSVLLAEIPLLWLSLLDIVRLSVSGAETTALGRKPPSAASLSPIWLTVAKLLLPEIDAVFGVALASIPEIDRVAGGRSRVYAEALTTSCIWKFIWLFPESEGGRTMQ